MDDKLIIIPKYFPGNAEYSTGDFHFVTRGMACSNYRHGSENGGGPFAAIVVRDGKIIGTGTNQAHVLHDPSAHAELLAIREACETLQSVDLSDCVPYASGEPCPMCLGAAYWLTVGHI